MISADVYTDDVMGWKRLNNLLQRKTMAPRNFIQLCRQSGFIFSQLKIKFAKA